MLPATPPAKPRIIAAVCAGSIDCLIYLNRGGDGCVAAT
jgi:hypothetical protein